jgi:hypothetical protein
MTKEFIPYEQAVELKEIGFCEECFGCYQLAEFRDYRVGLEVDNKIVLNTLNGYRNYDNENQIPAPLYQQAFRWFREKYRLYSAVNVDQTMEPKFAYCISEYCSNALTYGWNTIVFNSDLYYTYEEAELECLKKLIEIVKNK